MVPSSLRLDFQVQPYCANALRLPVAGTVIRPSLRPTSALSSTLYPRFPGQTALNQECGEPQKCPAEGRDYSDDEEEEQRNPGNEVIFTGASFPMSEEAKNLRNILSGLRDEPRQSAGNYPAHETWPCLSSHDEPPHQRRETQGW